MTEPVVTSLIIPRDAGTVDIAAENEREARRELEDWLRDCSWHGTYSLAEQPPVPALHLRWWRATFQPNPGVSG